MPATAVSVTNSQAVELRVPVDFNARDRRGLLRVRRPLLGTAAPGAPVVAFDEEDDTECSAQVEILEGEFGYLSFEAQTARPITSGRVTWVDGPAVFKISGNKRNEAADGFSPDRLSA